MLRYLDFGRRKFGVEPIRPYKRFNWEFYAVINGECQLKLQDCEDQPMRTSNLWILPPQSNHGWHGRGEDPCEVAVFHFNRVPSVLVGSLPETGFLEKSLEFGQRLRVQELALEHESDFSNPTTLSKVRTEKALLELTLLALSDKTCPSLPNAERRAEEKVEEAIDWYRENLHKRPSIEDLASAVHISPTHLRRLFAKTREESPHEAMNRIRLIRAAELLAETDAKLDYIAAECGFSNASAFCRSFKAHKGCSPNTWRARIPKHEEARTIWRQIANVKKNLSFSRSVPQPPRALRYF